MGRCDLTGRRFSRWTVMRRAFGRASYWVCRCDCGTEKDVAGYSLKALLSHSCGCYLLERVRSQEKVDLRGRRFGRLIVLRIADRLTPRPGKRASRRHWICRCDCGEETVVYAGSLGSGNTRSCGCLQRKVNAVDKTRHSHNRKGFRSREYASWAAMKRRCHCPTNPDYCNYGARGIRVCDRWRGSFKAFLEDVGPCPGPGYSIDREDNSRGYESGNVRWATPKQQSRNTRKNVLLGFRGETLPMSEWAERLGIRAATLSARIRAGWPLERALTTPLITNQRTIL